MTRFLLVLLGIYVGLVGAVVHRHRVELWGVDWPWGLALALGGTVAVAIAAGRIVRLGDAWFAIGWGLLLFAQSAAPVGSYLVASDWLGWSYSLIGVGSLGLVVVRNPRLGR